MRERKFWLGWLVVQMCALSALALTATPTITPTRTGTPTWTPTQTRTPGGPTPLPTPTYAPVLITGLGGPRGFGEHALLTSMPHPNTNDFSQLVDVSSVFPAGITNEHEHTHINPDNDGLGGDDIDPDNYCDEHSHEYGKRHADGHRGGLDVLRRRTSGMRLRGAQDRTLRG